MGKLSRTKGKVGEREAAALLRKFGFEAKRGVQYHGGTDSPDVKHNIPGVHIEVKRVERLNVSSALKQASDDAKGLKPVVLHRSSRQAWLVTMPAEDWLADKMQKHVSEYSIGAHSQEPADTLSGIASEVGREFESAARGGEEGEGRSGPSLTGMDTAA